MLIRDKHIDPTANLVKRKLSIGLAPAINLTNGVIALVKFREAAKMLAAGVFTRLITATVSINLRVVGATDRIIPGVLAIDAVPEKFKLITNTAVYTVAGVVKTKAPATAIVFTANHVITALKYGAILVQVNAAGTVSTKVVSATQAFATAALALASLPEADTANVALGYIAIANNAGDWTANTDDLTDASDVTTATFVNYGIRAPLTGTITPVAASEVEGTVSSTSTDVDIDADEYLAVIATTDGTGALTDARLDLDYRAKAYRGEA